MCLNTAQECRTVELHCFGRYGAAYNVQPHVGIEADEFQKSSDEQLDAFSKTIIKLDRLDWYSFEDINVLSEIV